MDKISFGEVLRIVRIANDLSKNELSRNVCVSVSYICEIEKGRKSPSNVILEKLLNYYNISNDEFEAIILYYESLKKKDKLKKYQLTLLYVLKLFEKRL